MQGIYEFSSSDRVKRLEEELSQELKELQNAIEENDFLRVTPNSQKSLYNFRFKPVAIYFQVREARSLECQADIMKEEMNICLKEEYTNESLPLLLHQVKNSIFNRQNNRSTQ